MTNQGMKHFTVGTMMCLVVFKLIIVNREFLIYSFSFTAYFNRFSPTLTTIDFVSTLKQDC